MLSGKFPNLQSISIINNNNDYDVEKLLENAHIIEKLSERYGLSYETYKKDEELLNMIKKNCLRHFMRRI